MRNIEKPISSLSLQLILLFGAILLFAFSCQNSNSSGSESSYYHNMNQGRFNIIVEANTEDESNGLILRGTVDNQALQSYQQDLNSPVLTAQLGDINVDGIPEVFLLNSADKDSPERLQAFTIVEQEFKEIEVKDPEMRNLEGYIGKDELEFSEMEIVHSFEAKDSAGNNERRSVTYKLLENNGAMRLVCKPDLSDLSTIILNEGIENYQVGDSLEKLPVPESLKLEKEKRELTTEEGPFDQIIYSLVHDGYQILEMFSNDDETIDQIFLNDTHFKTSEGIGVHSRLRDLTSVYPDFKLWYTYVSDRFIAETPILPRVQFLIERDAYAGPVSKLTEARSEQRTLSLEDFTREAKIEQVRVF